MKAGRRGVRLLGCTCQAGDESARLSLTQDGARLLESAVAGAQIGTVAGAALEVGPIAGHAAIDERPDRPGPRHVIVSRPTLNRGQHFTRKTNANCGRY